MPDSIEAAAFYVSPSGSDSNPGTLASPFLTLGKAQMAMRGGSAKTAYLRSGTYSSVALALSVSDGGETWSYYPADGYDSAILDGGSNSPGTGGNPITIDGGSNITINGLTIRNCRNWCVGVHGGSADPNALFATTTATADSVTIKNSIIHDNNTVGTWTGGNIWYSTNVTNLTVSNNAIYDCQGFCIAGYTHYTYNAGDSPDDHTLGNFSGLLIKGNVIYLACITTADCGAVYFQDQTTQYGTGSKPIAITNNFIRDYQGSNPSAPTGLCRAVAIYLDDGASNATISGNVIANTANVPSAPTGPCGSTTAYWVNNGRNNTFSGNIIDLGTTARIAAAGLAATSAPNPTFPMTGNTVTRNILIGSWAGAQQAALLGGGSGTSWFYGGTPATPVPSNNLYYNYGSGSLSTAANISSHNDSSPVTSTDPEIGGSTLYPIAADSPVYESPLSFPPIVGGYGPPGYTVPSGTAPSP